MAVKLKVFLDIIGNIMPGKGLVADSEKGLEFCNFCGVIPLNDQFDSCRFQSLPKLDDFAVIFTLNDKRYCLF